MTATLEFDNVESGRNMQRTYISCPEQTKNIFSGHRTQDTPLVSEAKVVKTDPQSLKYSNLLGQMVVHNRNV